MRRIKSKATLLIMTKLPLSSFCEIAPVQGKKLLPLFIGFSVILSFVSSGVGAALRINTNMAAGNAYRNLTGAQNEAQRSVERLSTGLRINKTSDDAAGLAISEKLRSQIRGFDQTQKNAQDGISLPAYQVVT